jgi:uncharacterized protein YegL
MNSKITEFKAPRPRPLPVILLCDVSGTMAAKGKIETLNQAVAEMIKSFGAEEDVRAEIQIGIITFGHSRAAVHAEIRPASEASWVPMEAKGKTPLGEALSLATAILEDPAKLPSRAFRPALILLSDGQPTDEWKEPLNKLLSSPRGSKADRFALAIGEDADMSVLKAFLANPERKVFTTTETQQIRNFFRWVTMSVTARSRSVNPNQEVDLNPAELPGDFEF